MSHCPKQQEAHPKGPASIREMPGNSTVMISIVKT